jgi:hypothetical protein
MFQVIRNIGHHHTSLKQQRTFQEKRVLVM